MFRATLQSLLSRKLRLVLSGLAVVLGVMFVSGAFVLTDTLGRSFEGLFATAYSTTDVEASAKRTAPEDDAPPPTVPAEAIAQARSVPGVARATGLIQADGAGVIGANGKVVGTGGAPRFGVNWTGENDLIRVRDGRGPNADDEIAINAGLATAAGLKVGDAVGVLTLEPKRTFRLVGILEYSGGRSSLGGSHLVAFTEPVAARLMLGETGRYSAIDIDTAAGVPDSTVRDRVQSALGSGFEVKTGEQLQRDATDDAKADLGFLNNILLGFAAVALFVGSFLILNTFSILVAQRTRELALLRALGAGRRQVIGSVVLEAAVIGLLASVIGLGAGIGVGAGLAKLFGSLGGGGLQLAGIGVPAAAVIGAFAVGMVTTMIAALLPALRAARIPPVAALREAAAADRPLTRLSISGALVGAGGATLLGLGLAGQGDSTLWYILGGVLVSFIGVALLTPLIARPVVHVIGRLLSWSVPGRLGRLNSARNPRRTAITAAALMVGLALITGVNIVLTSATASLEKTVDRQLDAELVIAGEGDGAFDPAVLGRAEALPGVDGVTGLYFGRATINGETGESVTAVSDVAAAVEMFSLTAVEGRLETQGADQILLSAERAKELGVHAGSTIELRLPRGEPHTTTVTGVYADNELLDDRLLGPGAVTELHRQQPSMAFIGVQSAAAVADVKRQVDALLADSPEVTVGDRSEALEQATAEVDTVLMMVQILLGLAILIAVLGVINTMALSVLERTRELGLLRAIGLGRAQTMRMVTVEAVVISVFGAVLGLAVGSGLGAAVVRALKDDGIATLAFPWSEMAIYLLLAVLVGVVAAVIPAIRAARVNVLNAIAYE
ncbi:MAG TPA: FtsX-like permease family protein [Micromonosporaceae bacterium]|nr:FtsX-like permease family protein [Micromonosporaceae bacterium]